jgi:hypothetical protein
MFSIKKSGIRSATIGSVATLLLCVAVGGGNNLAQAQTPVP